MLDVGALEDAVASELDVAIVPRDGALRVRVTPRDAGRVVVELTRADGRTLRRVARLDPDRAERVQTLVIVIANLARNEADELLAQLRRSQPEDEPAPVVEVEPPPPDPPAPPVAPGPSVAPVAPADVVAATPEVEAEIEAAPPVVADAEPVELEAPAVPDATPPHDPLLRFGLDAQLGSVPGGTGGLELAWLAGLQLAWTPLPFFALAVRDLGGGYSRTARWDVGGALVGELAWRFADWGDLHVQLGVHAQSISSGETAGIAPLLVIGGRLLADRSFSISIETALRYVATNTFHTGIELVPQGALVWTGGLSLAFHVL